MIINIIPNDQYTHFTFYRALRQPTLIDCSNSILYIANNIISYACRLQIVVSYFNSRWPQAALDYRNR